MQKFHHLPHSFFLQPTLTVAQQLLGKILVVQTPNGIKTGIISETEAYVGTGDKACHASKGKTARTETMWKSGGHLYVYLIYGMYFCANIVTEQKGFPAAVLLRGVIPLENLDGKINGPGKLCKALGIIKKHNGIDLVSSKDIFLADAGIRPKRIRRTSRVGVDYAGVWAKKPWRFIAEFD